MTRTYYALTTENARDLGWHIVADGANARDVERDAEGRIGPNIDIGAETLNRNLVIVTAAVARRRYGIGEWALDRYDRYLSEREASA